MPRFARFSQKPYLVLITAGSRLEAGKIAKTLLSKKLAACVSLLSGVDSLFRWKGKIDRAREFQLIIKTDKRFLKPIEKVVRGLHSYEVPEIIGWPIAWGSRAYLDWISESLA